MAPQPSRMMVPMQVPPAASHVEESSSSDEKESCVEKPPAPAPTPGSDAPHVPGTREAITKSATTLKQIGRDLSFVSSWSSCSHLPMLSIPAIHKDF